jgi:hypothetical protein
MADVTEIDMAPEGAPAAPSSSQPARTATAITSAPKAAPEPPQDATAGTESGSGWRAHIPAELKRDKTLADIKGESWEEAGPQLMKMVVNSQKIVGQRLQPPKADAPPEELAKWRDLMGVPKDPSAYTPPEAPEGKSWDPGLVQMAQGYFHTAGLTPGQADAIFKAFTDYEAKALELKDRQYEDGIHALREQWGEARYARDISKAANLVKEHDEDGKLAEWLDATREGNNPVFVAFLASLAQEFREDQLHMGTVPGIAGKSEAQAEIARILADPKHPAMDPDAPGHAQAHERYLGLQKLVHGTGPIRR